MYVSKSIFIMFIMLNSSGSDDYGTQYSEIRWKYKPYDEYHKWWSFYL